MVDEIFLNGIFEEEAGRYYHIRFFGSKDENRSNSDNYVFVPKVVCRVVNSRTVAIQEWYVKKHKLTRFTQRHQREHIEIDMDKIRMQQAARKLRREGR